MIDFDSVYDELFEEPSNAHQIISKAIFDLEQCFGTEIKNLLDSAASARKELEAANREIREAQVKLNRIRKETEEAECKAEESELERIPQKYVDRFVRNAIGDFAPGDTVWTLDRKWANKPCPTCFGEKTVTAEVGGIMRHLQCPECKGSGKVDDSKWETKKRTIQDIRLKLCFEKDYRYNIRYWSLDNIRLNGNDGYHKKDGIYKTEEEAEAALERMAGE